MRRRAKNTAVRSLLTTMIVFGCLLASAIASLEHGPTVAGGIHNDIEVHDRDTEIVDEGIPEEIFGGYTSVNETSQASRRIIEQKTIFETGRKSAVNQSASRKAPANYPRLKRLLVTVSDYYDMAFKQLPPFLQLSSIFILVAMLTNNFELLLPIIEYTQMFFFLGFFNILKGRFDDFFSGFNSGKIDPYRLLGMMFPFQFTNPAGTPAPISTYGLNVSILSNLLPDISIIVLATIVYLLTKLLTACTKSEMVRKINFAFKSIWNGLVYVESMRFCFFIGLQGRFASVGSALSIVEIVLMGVAGIVVIGFPIKLGLEIKAFIEDRENEQLMTSIGLIAELDHEKRFEFDCLNYSNMYFPIMNYTRHVIFFTCVGASYDITKIQIGGTIVALFLFFTIFFNEPPYRNRRNNITIFISNLIILLLVCCLISIDIAETISHPEISTPIAFASILLYLVGLVFHIIMIVAALIIKIINRKKEKKEESLNNIVKEHINEAKQEENARFKRGNNTTDNEKAIFGVTSHSERSEISVAEDEKPKESAVFESTPVRVKKVKNARII